MKPTQVQSNSGFFTGSPAKEHDVYLFHDLLNNLRKYESTFGVITEGSNVLVRNSSRHIQNTELAKDINANKSQQSYSFKNASNRSVVKINNSAPHLINNSAVTDITTLTAIDKTPIFQEVALQNVERYIPVTYSGRGWRDAIKQPIVRGASRMDDSNWGDIGDFSPSGNVVNVETQYLTIPTIKYFYNQRMNIQENQEYASATDGLDLQSIKEYFTYEIWEKNYEMLALGEGFKAKQGMGGLTNIELTQTSGPAITVNTTLFTQRLSEANGTDFGKMVANIVAKFYEHSDYTAKPDMFVMPETDRMNLVNQISEYKDKTRLQFLQEALDQAAGKKVTIIGNYYFQKDINTKGKDRYAVYVYNPRVLGLDHTVPMEKTGFWRQNGLESIASMYGQMTPLFVKNTSQFFLIEIA
tara:strand:+ start:619 stop:1857 length:1239 start_codon:yes stop_codon:yes gene_type:complete